MIILLEFKFYCGTSINGIDKSNTSPELVESNK